MNRTLLISILSVLCLASTARADRLEVSTDFPYSEITVQGAGGAWSSAGTLAAELNPGGYWLSVSRGDRVLGRQAVDFDGSVHLRQGTSSRLGISLLLPGGGQFRDDGRISGLIVGGSPLVLLARGLQHRGRASDLLAQGQSLGTSTAGQVLRGDGLVYEQSRDRYMALAGAFYAGNLLDAMVRRGPVRFSVVGSRSVRASYAPLGGGQAALLSAAWPGLGQLRAGHQTRARVWNILALVGAVGWAEAQRELDQARADRDAVVLAGPGSVDYESRLGRAQGEIEDQKTVSDVVLGSVIALWAYNIVDAVVSVRGSGEAAPAMARNGGERPAWTLAPGLVGASAGLVLDLHF